MYCQNQLKQEIIVDLKKSLRMSIAERGIKNKELAKGLGVTPQQITTWLRTGVMTNSNILKISNFFNIQASEFIALGE